MLQISSGILRGLKLQSPSGNQTRPSSERLRQGVFNILRNFRWQETGAPILQGAAVVDLFAGSGAWGIEAIANGAAEVVFVESHPSALATLAANLTKASSALANQGVSPRLEVVKKDAIMSYAKLPNVRVLFADPPYEKGYFEKILHEEDRANRVAPGGVLIVETREGEAVPPVARSVRLFETKNYGDSNVHFFVKLSHDSAGNLSG